MNKFDFLPHTADLKIRAYGTNDQELLSNALLALIEYLSPQESRFPKQISKVIEINADNKIDLWIDFLNEVLTQMYINKFKPEELEFIEISDKKIKAKIIGNRWQSIKKDIKSITYHQAEINTDKYPHEFTFICDI